MRENRGHLRELEAALAEAVSGRPTTVHITGAAGMGKSTLVDELVASADRFGLVTVVRAECLPSATPTPYEVLRQLGIVIDGEGDAMPTTLAAQRVRRWLDEMLPRGPVALIVDDAQWADDESIEVSVSVMSRALAEKLLLCVATRPLEPGQHPTFQRWASRPGRVRRVELTGLDLSDARALLEEVRPGIPVEVATAVWKHVSGNPLYLRSLAEEHDPQELSRTVVLPAPAQFTTAVIARSTRLSQPAQALGRALAVLGLAWSSLRDLAYVAEVADPTDAAEELTESRIVVARSTTSGEELRFRHSLIRSAIYQQIPLSARRSLHSRASDVASGIAAAFEHQIAATAGFDERLAEDLEEHAASLRGRRDFAPAARFQRLAADLTAARGIREQRRLDSMFDRLLAMDHAGVHAELPELEDATDRRRRDLVLGVLAVWERRPHEAVAILGAWAGRGGNDVTQRRVETMLAWALLQADAPETEIRAALSRAGALPPDTVVDRFGLLVTAQLVTRHTTNPLAVPVLQGMPEVAQHVPVAASSALAWRGALLSDMGHFSRGIADLTEVTDRMQRGQIEFSSGTLHGVLGRALWFAGDWSQARVSLRTASEWSADHPHPLVVVSTPLYAIGRGTLDEADEQLAHAHEVVQHVPWREAVDQLTVVDIIRAHAGLEPDPELFGAAVRPVLADVTADRVSKSVLWLTHAALAAVWADQAAVAADLAERITHAPSGAPWVMGMADWIRGLNAEAAGDGRAALRHLAAATEADLSSIPLYRAHAFADHARIAHLVQGPSTARPSLDIAAETYRTLGADRYLNHVVGLQDASAGASTGPATNTAPPVDALQFSDRERDVMTLVVSGMSYAQVARDLFITQSTVSYHLGNIYAKANVKSRHQLTQLARTTPATLGLTDMIAAGG